MADPKGCSPILKKTAYDEFKVRVDRLLFMQNGMKRFMKADQPGCRTVVVGSFGCNLAEVLAYSLQKVAVLKYIQVMKPP